MSRDGQLDYPGYVGSIALVMLVNWLRYANGKAVKNAARLAAKYVICDYGVDLSLAIK